MMQQIYMRTLLSKCDFNKVALATFLKSHFDMDVLLKIGCIFAEHLFLRTPESVNYQLGMQATNAISMSLCY